MLLRARLLFAAAHVVVAAASPFADAAALKDAVNAWVADAAAAEATFGHISGWDVSAVTSLESLFQNLDLNEDLNGWDTSQVVSMKRTFQKATLFNSELNGWDVSRVADFGRAFFQANSFDRSLVDWDTRSANTMFGMFRSAIALTHDAHASWNVSAVTNFNVMFDYADALSNCSRCAATLASTSSLDL